MEKWEEEGFASEEAYAKYQQTIKELTEKSTSLQAQVEEKQKVIDSNRTKISELTDIRKDRDALQEKLDEIEAEKKKAEEEAEKQKLNRTPDKIKESNTKRIDDLSDEDRAKLADTYEKADEKQRELLDTPQGLEAFLDVMLAKEEGSPNPFTKKKASTTKDMKTQIKEAFNIVDKEVSGPSAHERHGSGFDVTLSEPLKKKQDEFTKQREATKLRLLS